MAMQVHPQACSTIPSGQGQKIPRNPKGALCDLKCIPTSLLVTPKSEWAQECALDTDHRTTGWKGPFLELTQPSAFTYFTGKRSRVLPGGKPFFIPQLSKLIKFRMKPAAGMAKGATAMALEIPN